MATKANERKGNLVWILVALVAFGIFVGMIPVIYTLLARLLWHL